MPKDALGKSLRILVAEFKSAGAALSAGLHLKVFAG